MEFARVFSVDLFGGMTEEEAIKEIDQALHAVFVDGRFDGFWHVEDIRPLEED